MNDIVVLNIGQSQSRVTDLADDSCGKMAPQKVVRGAGMGDWQGVSSHALGTVTVNRSHNSVSRQKNQESGDVINIEGWLYLGLSSRLSDALQQLV